VCVFGCDYSQWVPVRLCHFLTALDSLSLVLTHSAQDTNRKESLSLLLLLQYCCCCWDYYYASLFYTLQSRLILIVIMLHGLMQNYKSFQESRPTVVQFEDYMNGSLNLHWNLGKLIVNSQDCLFYLYVL